MLGRCAVSGLWSVLLVSAAFLSACVTENPRPTAGLYHRKDAIAPALPDSKQLNHPVDPGDTFQSHVTFAVEPLGSVAFDGMVLPLISTNGRYLVVQEGEPATWDALLGESGAPLPLGTRLAIYSIEPRSTQGGGVHRLDNASSALPPGLLLGRSADATGFLVESPQPNGSRWIGRAEFETGRVTWLVQGDAMNMHAAFGPPPAGVLVYCVQESPDRPRHIVVRRDPADPRSELVVNMPDESLVYPAVAPDGLTLSAASLSPSGLWLRAFSLKSATAADPPRSVGKWFISPSATLLAAYQAFVAAPPPGEPRPQAVPVPPSLMWYLAGRQRGMVGIDPDTGRTFSAGPATYAVEWAGSTEKNGSASAAMYLCAQPDGLWFRSLSATDTGGGLERARTPEANGVQAIPGEFVPRRTSDPDRPFLLISPVDAGTNNRLRIFGVSVHL